MSRPLVSVVMPVFNGASHIEESLQTVVNQTYSNIEIIVVDDGSADESAEIARSFEGVRVLTQENKGVPFARNKGAAAAQGTYLSFIDQDDHWLSKKTELQVAAFQNDLELRYCTVKQIWRLAEGFERPQWCMEDWLDRPLAGYVPSALMIERAFFCDFGTFETSLTTGSDSDYFFRLKDHRVVHLEIDEVLLTKFVHGENQSSQRELIRKDIMETVRRSIHRKRMLENQ